MRGLRQTINPIDEYCDMKENVRIIGIDYSNGDDHTVVTQKCSACNYIISSEVATVVNKTVTPKVFTECPECGVKFKKRIMA